MFEYKAPYIYSLFIEQCIKGKYHVIMQKASVNFYFNVGFLL